MKLISPTQLFLISTLLTLLPGDALPQMSTQRTNIMSYAFLWPQSGRPDDRPSPAPTRTPPKTLPGKTKTIKRTKPVRENPSTTLTITVNPSDSTVQVDNLVSFPDSSGTIRLTDLKTTEPHFVVVRRAGFKDYALTVELNRGVNNTVSVVLEPVPGVLNVATFDVETLVVVKQAGSLQEVSRHTGAVSEMPLAPGDYLVQTSKPGFKTAERTVSIRRGQSIYLEPKLEQIEVPKPTPPKPIAMAAPMSSSVRAVDKYFEITVQGAAGVDDAQSGTVDIISSRTETDLTGALSGMPCIVELVRLENAAEVSMVEVPAPANRWSRAVLRVKPKDPKRLIHVALNWRVLSENTPLLLPDTTRMAEAIYKAVPVFPPAARVSNTEGNVAVEVTIDDRGQVIAAKAISGPVLLRAAAEEAARKWKFRPAKRNGIPVQTSQTILFNFQRRSN